MNSETGKVEAKQKKKKKPRKSRRLSRPFKPEQSLENKEWTNTAELKSTSFPKGYSPMITLLILVLSYKSKKKIAIEFRERVELFVSIRWDKH